MDNKENKLSIKIEGHEITDKDVDQFLMTMGQEGMRFNNEEGKKQIATELMNQHLIYLDAIENGLEDDPEFQKELAHAKEQILRQYSMKRVLEAVRVSEEEAKEYYARHKDDFKPIYMYKASHILVDDEDKAKEIKGKLDQGEAFEDLAKANSTCPSAENGGDLGTFATGQMVPEFDIALEQMQAGQISDPVKTQFGHHIIKLEEKDLARDVDFESNRADIESMLLGQKQQEAYLEKTEELQKKYGVEKNF